MKNLLRCLLLSSGLAGLAGCCANNSCNCQDLLRDALYLTFKPDATGSAGFTPAELATVYVGRYNYRDDLRGQPRQTAVLTRLQRRSPAARKLLLDAGQDTTGLLVISNTFPFAPVTTGSKIDSSSYKIVLTANPRVAGGPRRFVFYVSRIQLQGRYQGDGCCTCYVNTYKEVFVRDSLNQLSAPTTGTRVLTEDGDRPVPIVLPKPR